MKSVVRVVLVVFGLALLGMAIEIGGSPQAHAADRSKVFYYNPFHILENPIGNPQAEYIYNAGHASDPASAVALFEPAEFNRFKKKLVTREAYSIDSEVKKSALRRILGITTESPLVPWFKFALALSPLPYAIEAALATNDLINSLPVSVEKTRGDLGTIIRLGGKIYVTETIEAASGAFVYSRVVSYQIAVGAENVQVILGASHLRAEVR